jgi:hypothetical protein
MSNTKPAFRKATKRTAKLRAALFGPSGAGKTFTALRIATGLGGTVAVIDTERGSASKYADRFAFDVLELDATRIEDYTAAIKLAGDEGYKVLIIDSLSHGWQELLSEVDRLAQTKYKGNTWSAWSEGTPKQRALVDAILGFPGHVLVTMRAKTEWTTDSDSRGKSRPVRVGLAPEQGKGIEYEFDLLLELSTSHVGQVIKDRTGKFQDVLLDKPGEDFGKDLRAWLESGVEPPATTAGAVTTAGTETAQLEDQPSPTDVRADEIEDAVKAKVAKLVARTQAKAAWSPAEEWARKNFTGQHLRYCLEELAAAKKAATDPAQAAIDAAKTAAAA